MNKNSIFYHGAFTLFFNFFAVSSFAQSEIPGYSNDSIDPPPEAPIDNYLIYTIKNLLTFQGRPITESDRNTAWMQFGIIFESFKILGQLRQLLSSVSPRLLNTNQSQYLPFSHIPIRKKCFQDSKSDNESTDSDSFDQIKPMNERLCASMIISCGLKQKRIIEEFEVEWRSMIDDVFINH